MKITNTHEPIRSIYAPDNYSAFAKQEVLGPEWLVDYGSTTWPSRSYWIVPGTIDTASRWF